MFVHFLFFLLSCFYHFFDIKIKIRNMKAHLLTLCILFGFFLSISLAYGDDIPIHGEWDDEDYCSITALPPTLSIEKNVLSVKLVDALDDLTIYVTDEAGIIIYENTISGNIGEVFSIPLSEVDSNTYQVILTHKLGCLVGKFEN